MYYPEGATQPEPDELARIIRDTEAFHQVRAKRRIRDARIPYRVPGDAELLDRLCC